MADAIRHRGPDDCGEWGDERAGIALAHRRLSILDLSPEGHQPMISPSGRYVIVFNGEVYNFEEIRSRVPGYRWRGHSDTEVMLAAIESWGLERAVREFLGMFAFALWDSYEHELYLVRDRLGIKPLYYGRCGRHFLFGSELRALRAHPAFDDEIDRGALGLLMRHNYIPHPYSIYRRIHKLPPGTILRVRTATEQQEPRPFWSAREIAEAGSREGISQDAETAVEMLHELLRDAVRLRMIADVPLGAFLSGGIDSSTVVALMQAQSTRPVRTFSIGFAETEYNEAPFAAQVARHLGTEHTELYVTPAEAQAVVPKLPEYFDEPFADSSQIPTFLVSALARQTVTISLSGDGGDELFAGYPRYILANQIWQTINRFPRAARRGAAAALRSLSADSWTSIFKSAASMMPDRIRRRRPGEQMHRLAALLCASSAEAVYHRLISHWDPAELVLDGDEPPTALTDSGRQANLANFTSRMMFLDLVSYLPDDILTKVDRASMAVSLEARVPLLDHRVVQFAWRIPMSLRIRDGKEKWLLRQVLFRYVPPKLVERGKMGFGVPVGEWLRGALRDWAEALLERGRLAKQAFFDADVIRSAWHEHLSGKRNRQYELWDVLMFQAWLEHQEATRTVPSEAVYV
jgi:asparagine synthase (glutamine-hydrolysing)